MDNQRPATLSESLWRHASALRYDALPARVVEKIKDLYVEKGFYMAEVTYEVKRDTPSTVDVWFHDSEHAKVEVRRVNFVGNQTASLRGLGGSRTLEPPNPVDPAHHRAAGYGSQGEGL